MKTYEALLQLLDDTTPDTDPRKAIFGLLKREMMGLEQGITWDEESLKQLKKEIEQLKNDARLHNEALKYYVYEGEVEEMEQEIKSLKGKLADINNFDESHGGRWTIQIASNVIPFCFNCVKNALNISTPKQDLENNEWYYKAQRFDWVTILAYGTLAQVGQVLNCLMAPGGTTQNNIKLIRVGA